MLALTESEPRASSTPLPFAAKATPVSVTWPCGPENGIKAFTGREWDPETNLYYYRARYYDPKVGRFISEDPIGFDGGVNFYGYADAGPTTATDPSGLLSDPGGTYTRMLTKAFTRGAGAGAGAAGLVMGGALAIVTAYALADEYEAAQALNLSEMEAAAANDNIFNAHRKGRRESTRDDHEVGEARFDRDHDLCHPSRKHRPHSKRPKGWSQGHQGPWPPRTPTPTPTPSPSPTPGY
jgi:RHS repeat-associated protein